MRSARAVANGRPWADGLTRVTVAPGGPAKRLTLVFPYYESPTFLARQYAIWQSYAPDVRPAVIVVDDGSPVAPAAAVLAGSCGVRLFRIEVDVPWNWLAARNIGAHHAEDGWLLLTDMDHVVPPETLGAVLTGDHHPAVVYAFARREHTGAALHPHSASFLMTREMFWTIGGYDERLSGVYGTDGAYRRRLSAAAPIHVLTDHLIRHEYQADSSVTTYERKTPAMRAAKHKRLAAIRPHTPPVTLSFPYHEVAL